MSQDNLLNKKYEEDWEEPQAIPKCILSQLTTCVLRNFKGMDCEVHFAKYIMKNSRVLRSMIIQSSIDANVRLQMLRELSLCPKSSTACKLLFI